MEVCAACLATVVEAEEADAARVERHLRAAKLPTRLADIDGSLPEPRKLLEIMRQDKKAVAGKLTFILVRGVGEAFIARGVEEKDVLAFLAGAALSLGYLAVLARLGTETGLERAAAAR